MQAAGKQGRAFEHGADLAPHQPEIEVLEVLVVIGNAAARRRFEPEQQAEQRRLARAGGPDDGDALARPHVEVDALQHPRSVVGIAEPQVAHRDGAGQRAGIGPVLLDLERCVEDGTQSGEDRQDVDRAVHGIGQTHDRSRELAEGGVEGGECPDIDRVVATGGDAEDADGADERQARGGDRLQGVGAQRPGSAATLMGKGGRPAREGTQLGGGDAQLGDAADQLDQKARDDAHMGENLLLLALLDATDHEQSPPATKA